ncbi:MAG: DotH/IcmK family type IV secretion protein, partial [Alphaproteobacteria bacterium]|nr:DotH/IcmK family type IV secretion protein [Alphaproteobacteria bacterium]
MCLNILKNGSLLAVVLATVTWSGIVAAQSPLPPRGGAGADMYDDALPETGGGFARDGGMELSPDSGAFGDVENPFEEPEPVIEKTKEEIDREIREASFTAAITGLLPLNPGEIRQLLKRFDETQQAVEIPVYPYPQPEVSVHTVSLDPGVTPPVIKLGVGHVTTLNIMDATGQPWPIFDLSWAGNFEVLQPGEGSHVVRITPMSEFAYGNLSLRVVKMSTPITFTLKTQRDVVQYRFDARIPEFGPYAKAPLIEGGLSIVAGNTAINSILDGTAPEGAEKLDV